MYSLRIYDHTGYTTHKDCPICGSENIEFFDQLASAPYMTVFVENLPFVMTTISTYYTCHDCKLIFQNPHMNEDQVKKYYKTGIYRSSLGMIKEDLMVDESRRGDGIRNFLVDAGITPVISTHLDIGAAHGYLVEKMAELGVMSKGYDLYGKYIGDEPPEKADLVTSVHVLEHSTNPRKQLMQYRALTNKWLLLEVPVQCEYKNRRGLRFSHIYSFPLDVVEKLVEDAGFKILISEQKPDTRILAEVV